MKKKSYKKQAIVLISMFLLVMVVCSLAIINFALGEKALEFKNPIILQNWVIFGAGIIALIVSISFLNRMRE